MNFFTIVYPVEVDLSDKTCISRRGALASSSLIAASTALMAAGRAYGGEFAEAIPLSPNDTISFLYIDNAQIEAGSEQNVVVSLSRHSGVSAGVLTVQDEAGAEQTCTACGVQDNALLFTYVPSGMGSCEVARLRFRVDGAAYEIDLSKVDESYRSYKVVPMALAYPDGEAASGPDLHVYTGDGGDELAESASIEEAASTAVAAASRSRTANPEKSGPLVIALDPGHVGVSSGAVANGTSEVTATWKVAQFCKAELDTYHNVTAVFTVTPDDRLDSSSELRERMQRALDQGADVLVSLHLNSTGLGNAYGAEVWAPHNTSYNNETHAVGTDLGNQILAQLQKLGLTNRGVKFRWIDPDPKYDYPDGSNGDYYGIIREARKSNLPAIIVEHAFLDNWSDYNNF
ncbi:MAG: N-acetylmuramoyl-L-alanine amidase [Coriobacteriaceae bacterium]|nr:N-acetylmuramoyl-L-alanine amidase [Coriobacteriaceae bacterium]